MKLGLSRGHPVGFDERRCVWRRIDDPRTRDIPVLLGAGPEVVSSLLGSVGEPPTGLPSQPGSLRAFGLWEAHMIGAAKGMVHRFGSAPLRALAKTYETVTRSVLPAMRPRRNYYRFPQYCMGNHRSLIADGEEVPWPSFSEVLDFELEIGVVISKQVRDCTPDEGLAAVGGFCVVNDWTARDKQWDDIRNGTFGGVVKAKTFANAMSPVVVTADEILPRFTQLSGRVRVNGEVWCEGRLPLPPLGLVLQSPMRRWARPSIREIFCRREHCPAAAVSNFAGSLRPGTRCNWKSTASACL